jgi:hypothetical protein
LVSDDFGDDLFKFGRFPLIGFDLEELAKRHLGGTARLAAKVATLDLHLADARVERSRLQPLGFRPRMGATKGIQMGAGSFERGYAERLVNDPK